MKFILKLLKEILNRVSNLYSNESVDELLSSKVGKEDSDGAIEGLAKSRKDNDDIVQGLIDSNKTYDEALSNVIKWQSYAASMQSMVDEDTAIQIAEEFEKAAEEYLKDPTATKEWKTSNTPYKENEPTRPLIDFAVTLANGSITNSVLNVNVNVPVLLPRATNCTRLLLKATSFNQPLILPNTEVCAQLVKNATSFNQPLSLPKATYCSQILYGAASFDHPVYLPACETATNAFYNAVSMSAGSIRKTLDSLPTWTDGGLHDITFQGCPGQVSTQYLEPFTVTDTDGTEYTLENCPRFDTDDENQTLRKSFVLAILKKGWTIDLSESALAWYEYTLEKATLTGEQKNIDLVNETLADYKADNTNVVAAQLIDNWRTLTEYAAFVAESGGADPFTQEFWVEYFRATEEYKADPTATKEWSTTNDADGNFSTTNPYYYESPTRPIVDFGVKYALGKTAYGVGCFNKNIDVPVFIPRAENISGVFGVISTNPVIVAPNAVTVSTAFANSTKYNQPLSFPKAKNCSYMLSGALSFNSNIYLPLGEDCNYLLKGSTSFNQPLNLPKAKNCLYMLNGATAFNQPLSLPNATNCQYMLQKATSFNQPLSLPNATNCLYMLAGAKQFNQPLSLPNATNCNDMLIDTDFNAPLNIPNARYCAYILTRSPMFNQPVELPLCHSAAAAFSYTGMSAENIAITLNSLKTDPLATSGASGIISFVSTPGIASTVTTETFTVTDEGGMEYSLENCPIFNTDDEAQTLRKAFVLAVVKKGWTVEL